MDEDHQSQKVKIIALYDQKTKKEQKYMLSLRVVGEGKYGKVYKAVHIDKPEVVFAVKVIKLNSEKVRQQCIKELQIIKHLPKCLNLVKIHPQHLQSENNFYIFEEFCDAGTLYDEKIKRKNNPFNQNEVFDIFFQVVSGFIELRKAGIFHEDIKPQNILKKNNLYKITDFGISQLADKHEVSIIRKGTLIYMPPEKLKQNKYVPTSKSQIFSLGVTLYEVFFGHPPYLSKKPTDYKNYLKMMSETSLRSVQDLKRQFITASLGLDKLIRILLRMVQKNEVKRLSLEELQDYIKNSQPFHSMKVVQSKDNGKVIRFSDKKKYDAIAYSKIFVHKSEGESISKAFHYEQSENIQAKFEILKQYLQYFRQAVSYLQQGIFYCKDTHLYELKKQYQVQGHHFNSKVAYLELLTAYFNDYALKQLAQKFNELILTASLNEDDALKIDEQVSADVQFTKNQFLKIFTEVELSNKKILHISLKQKQKQVGTQLVELFSETFTQINCIRINFKEDLLAVLFLKRCSEIIKFINDSLKLFMENGDKKILAKKIGSKQYNEGKKIMLDFSNHETIRRTKLEVIVQQQLKEDQQILYDIQSNSDQFEILEFEDTE